MLPVRSAFPSLCLLLALTATSLLHSTAAAKPVMDGDWVFGLVTSDPGHAYLSMTPRLNGERQGQWGRTLDLKQVRGLRADAFQTSGPVTFEIVRDAGTFACEGTMKRTHGAGTFEFRPDATFARELERRGVGTPSEDQQALLALADTGFGLLDALKREGYRTPSVSWMVTLGEHGVDAAYVSGLAAAGFRLGSLERLQVARDHGVTPDYISELRGKGFTKLSFDDYMEARDHGLSIDFIEELEQAGYSKLSYDDLLMARDHGVSEKFITGLLKAGFSDLPLQDVIRARDHGLNERKARRAREQLGPRATIDDAISWVDRGGR
jgi:hypothetical protein